MASWQESYAALEAKNNELAVELESLNEELESLKEMKHSLAEELNQYKDLEAEARNEVSNLNSRLESLGDEINKGKCLSEEMENKIPFFLHSPCRPDRNAMYLRRFIEWEAKVEQLNAKVASLETGSKQIGDASPVSEATNAFTTEDLGALLTLKEQELADVSAELEKVTKERDDAIAEHRQSGGAGTEEKAPSATIVSSWTDDLDDIDIDETKETGIQGDGKIVGDTKELKAKVEALELEVDKVTKERDTTSKALNEAQETVETWAGELSCPGDRKSTRKACELWICCNSRFLTQLNYFNRAHGSLRREGQRFGGTT